MLSPKASTLASGDSGESLGEGVQEFKRSKVKSSMEFKSADIIFLMVSCLRLTRGLNVSLSDC